MPAPLRWLFRAYIEGNQEPRFESPFIYGTMLQQCMGECLTSSPCHTASRVYHREPHPSSTTDKLRVSNSHSKKAYIEVVTREQTQIFSACRAEWGTASCHSGRLHWEPTSNGAPPASRRSGIWHWTPQNPCLMTKLDTPGNIAHFCALKSPAFRALLLGFGCYMVHQQADFKTR